MNDGLFTNRNIRSDFVINALDRLSREVSAVKIAVAFFTNAEAIHKITKAGSDVLIVVRLGFPTSPEALRSLLSNERVRVRYFTDHSFHPKLYLFGDQIGLVGSANLTDRALKTNQEIMVTMPAEDPRFEELAVLFSEYWEDAKVLTAEDVDQYASICSKYDEATNAMYKLGEDLLDQFGKVVHRNIQRDAKKSKPEDVFLEDYRKTYQETVGAFNDVRRVYEAAGYRKVAEDHLPLRLEIDSFISFVREKHARGETWRNSPLLDTTERDKKMAALVVEWKNTEWPWLEEHIVKEGYPQLRTVFSSAETLKQATEESLFEALCVVHSFRDRRRFYPGGLPTLKQEFFGRNNRDRIDQSLTYLVLGGEEPVKRMCRLIFSSAYKLNQFGRANVQELVGWINRDELPIINGRTLKVLRFLGFDVRS